MTSVGGTGRGTGRGGEGVAAGMAGMCVCGGEGDADGAVSAGLFIRQFGFSRFEKLDMSAAYFL